MKLENPYAFTRPSFKMLLSVPVLYGSAWAVSRYTGFLFAYQYAISIAAAFLAAYYLDREIISRWRITGKNEFFIAGISTFLLPVVLSIALILLSGKLFREPLLYLHFSSMGHVNRSELLVLMLVVAIPLTEILFRGHIQFALMNIMGKAAGSVITVIIYAGFFFVLSNNLQVLVTAASIGALLSFLYYRRQSVTETIAAHLIITLAMFIFHF